MLTMEKLQNWMENKFLEWQRENGRASLKKWSEELDISYTYLSNIMNGDNKSVSMKTAYQIGEKLGDYGIPKSCAKTPTDFAPKRRKAPAVLARALCFRCTSPTDRLFEPTRR